MKELYSDKESLKIMEGLKKNKENMKMKNENEKENKSNFIFVIVSLLIVFGLLIFIDISLTMNSKKANECNKSKGYTCSYQEVINYRG